MAAEREELHRSSRRTGMVISEIMYNPGPWADGLTLEFVEFFNSDPVPVDLSGWRLEGAVRHTFAPGTTLPPRSFLVLAAVPGDVEDRYGLSGVLAYEGNLDAQGGELQLFNQLGGLMLDLEYSARYRWPAAPAGSGHSLVLARPSYGEGDRRAWAASALKGGSPGAHEPELPFNPLDDLVINEFLAHTDEPEIDYVELLNTGTNTIDLSGVWLSDRPDENRYAIPTNTFLAPGEFIYFDENELPFAFAAAGEAVFVVVPDDTRVLDAIIYDAQLNGIPMGRVPDGGPEFTLLAEPTPGAPNSAMFESPVIINEIMFNPISGDDADTYVELYNRSTEPVDMTEWRFVDGISFAFPEGVILGPDEYLVIAKDRDRLIDRYPQLHSGNTLGDFGGRLANSGERLALAMPSFRSELPTDYVTVDEVHYRDGGRWGEWANRDGSSLELRDPRSDNRRAANWTHSDETAKSEWVLIEHTGMLHDGMEDNNRLHILLPSSGEVLLDDISVHQGSGPNLLANGDFASGISGWQSDGHHHIRWEDDEGFSNGRSLHLRANGGGDTGANSVWSDFFTAPLDAGQPVTIRARARWLAGHRQVLFRLRGNYLEVMGDLDIPTTLGTPGLPNTALTSNVGPAIYDVQHDPALPAASESITVTAYAHDPDGVASMTLHYRVDPSSTYTAVSMSGDGKYTATIPGQTDGTLVAYYIEGVDGHSTPATATYPDDVTQYEALVRFGSERQPGDLLTYNIWMTQSTGDELANRNPFGNERLPATLVYGDRVIQGIGLRYRGSPFRRRGGNPSGYSFHTPRDNRLLGVHEFTINSIPDEDPTGQREVIGYWMARQLGIPSPHSTYIHLFVNGQASALLSPINTDVHHINSDYVRTWYPDDDMGELFKGDDWFEFNDAISDFQDRDARLEEYRLADGSFNKTRYRWIWNKRSNRWLDDDYNRFFQMVEALNTPGDQPYTAAVESLIDIDQWLRTFAMRRVASEWDGYGTNRGKDAWLYNPERGPWKMFLWDLDKGFGAGSDFAMPLFSAEDPTVWRMYTHPPFRRAYLRAITDALSGPMTSSTVEPMIDAYQAALSDNGISISTWNIDTFKDWIQDRRSYLQSELGDYEMPFFAFSWLGEDPESPTYDLVGWAPLSVKSISVNGEPIPLSWHYDEWNDADFWASQVALTPGSNSLHFEAFDTHGKKVAETNLVITFSGTLPDPADYLIINEIMYDPLVPETEFIEIYNRSSQHAFDLSGFRLRGVDFDFLPGTWIGADSYLVVARNPYALQELYGPGIPVAGPYNGTLQSGGEQLRLVRLETDTEPELLIDEVNYSAFFPWPDGARGTGASIQRIDPAHSGDDPANWGVAPSVGNDWQFVAVTGEVHWNRPYIYLEDAGEVHIDDLRLVAGSTPEVGQNLLENGDFEQPLVGTWTISPNLADSQIVTNVAKSGDASLHVVASSGGTTQATAIWQDREGVEKLEDSPQPYTLSYWYLPNTNGAPLTIRFRYSDFGPGRIDHTQITTPQPMALATPGAPNTGPTELREIPNTSLLHYWNFNDTNAVLTPTYTIGDGALAIAPGPETVWLADDGQDFEGINARFGDEAGTHLRVNDPIGAEIEVALPTTGYSNIVVRYETRRSGQGAGRQVVEYTTNGMAYMPFTELEITETTRLQTFDFSAVPGVTDNPDFGLRVTFEMADGGTAGNNRFDNWTVEGSAMPGVNVPPFVYTIIPRQVAIEDGSAVQLNLLDFFVDPDDEPLSFIASAEVPGFADLSISNQWLNIQGLQRGETEIEVAADDGHNPPVPTTFRLLIYPAPHRLATGPYVFDEWAPNLPERTYPPHMLFLQTDESDTAIDSPLDYAYFIPHDQYHANDQGTIGFPYNNTGRSRITGLGEAGIAFINTGQDRDLGGALLAVDTRWLDESAEIDWLAGTVTPNSRIYAIRLQYRVGTDGPFIDVLDAHTNVIEYVRNDLAGHAVSMPTATLPTAALDQPYVQLLWRYYRISGTSGPRAELRLDDILVEGQPAVTANTGTPYWWLYDVEAAPLFDFDVAATQIVGQVQRPLWEFYVADVDPSAPASEWPRLHWERDGEQLNPVLSPQSPQREYQIWFSTNLVEDQWFELNQSLPDASRPVLHLRGTVELP